MRKVLMVIAFMAGVLIGTPAWAAGSPNGQFCSTDDHGQTTTYNGIVYRCSQSATDTAWRWRAVSTPSGVPTTGAGVPGPTAPSGTGSLTGPAGSPTAAGASSSALGVAGSDSGSAGGDGLPVTGAGVGLIAVVGALLLAAGAGLFVLARKRRVRFLT